MKKVGIFESVQDNREDLIAKAYASAKILRIVAIIGAILLAILVLPAMALALLGGAAGTMAAAEGEVAAGMAIGGLAVIALILLVIGIAVQIMMFVYTGKLKTELEQDNVPPLTWSYIFAVLTAIGIIQNITTFSIVGLIINGFIGYLWFVVISCLRKVNELPAGFVDVEATSVKEEPAPEAPATEAPAPEENVQSEEKAE